MVGHTASDGDGTGSNPVNGGKLKMVRIVEHYENTIKEELTRTTSSGNTHGLAELKGVNLHISIKTFKFDQYFVSPLIRLQELMTANNFKLTQSKTSEPEMSIRKDQITGINVKINSKTDLLNFLDLFVWHLSSLEGSEISDWSYKFSSSNNLGVRISVPNFELNELNEKDMAVDGVQNALIDLSFKLKKLDSNVESIRLLQGLCIPFEGVSFSQKKRLFRSKTVRKIMKKMQKPGIKKSS